MTEAAFLKTIRGEIVSTEAELARHPLSVRLKALRALLETYTAIQAPEPEPDIEEAAEDEAEQETDDSAAAAAPPPGEIAAQSVTAKQAAVFDALVKAAKKSSLGQAYAGTIQSMSGYSNVVDALTALELKGYIERVGEKGATRWKAIAGPSCPERQIA